MTTAPHGAATRPAQTGGCRILVVEDAPDLRELLRLTFEGEGHEVLSAVEAALRELPDAVVMDMSPLRRASGRVRMHAAVSVCS